MPPGRRAGRRFRGLKLHALGPYLLAQPRRLSRRAEPARQRVRSERAQHCREQDDVRQQQQGQ
ncbi:hypothetical protein ACTMU2_07185 [Cupriavidus basilensis]